MTSFWKTVKAPAKLQVRGSVNCVNLFQYKLTNFFQEYGRLIGLVIDPKEKRKDSLVDAIVKYLPLNAIEQQVLLSEENEKNSEGE
jgi:hypothetical protein